MISDGLRFDLNHENGTVLNMLADIEAASKQTIEVAAIVRTALCDGNAVLLTTRPNEDKPKTMDVYLSANPEATVCVCRKHPRIADFMLPTSDSAGEDGLECYVFTNGLEQASIPKRNVDGTVEVYVRLLSEVRDAATNKNKRKLGRSNGAFCRIYGREQGKKRFMALDLHSGAFVKNLMYASLFDTRGEAERALVELRRDNPDIEFEVREA